MKPYRVYSESGRELGRVLGRDLDDATKRARDCWPKEKIGNVVPVE